MSKKTPTEQTWDDVNACELESISLVPQPPSGRPLPYIVPMVGALLLCSVSFNVWVWASAAKERRLASMKEASLLNKLTTTQALLVEMEADAATIEKQAAVMKVMLGGGGAFTQAETEMRAQGKSGDPQMDLIFRQYKQDMSLFPPSVEATQRNYPALCRYLKKRSE